MFVIPFDIGRDATAIVHDGDRIVGVNRDVDFAAVASECFVDRVVQHFEYAMMQTGTVRGIADVHAGAFAHGFQTFEDLDGRCAVLRLCLRGVLVRDRGHGCLYFRLLDDSHSLIRWLASGTSQERVMYARAYMRGLHQRERKSLLRRLRWLAGTLPGCE